MEIIGSGLDATEIARIASTLERYGKRFVGRVFTDEEVAYCRRKRDTASSFAARFASKEAVMKALGTGIRGVRWRDIEIARKPGGPPTVVLHGTALARAQGLGLDHLAVSLSHSQEYAVAFVVGDSPSGNNIP